MPGTDPFSRLHDDLVAGILVLLPPKHVARARLVCRRWHLLTTDHHFVRTSFTLSRHAGRPVAGFFHNDQICVANYYFPLDRDAENDGDHPYPDLSFIPETSTNPWSIHVTSSCNGLLALNLLATRLSQSVNFGDHDPQMFSCLIMLKSVVLSNNLVMIDERACRNFD
ncbi:hypothetical protein PR202_gb03562 [Eleusine coracana subsp. coracana]|uniref:F-box domain-containing protein n=1 Tax=Eleusine coracana subsp. coracana TaxID=191504 RepID=A0AAV5DZQ1_ELECO|nr:hypothetical protein PR202_gb03545 [Eleusine coracana subsp. coracana]GJN16560.1 hypothetical protein PR202_gb03562 [Eleusine coracana subsp. coracana]